MNIVSIDFTTPLLADFVPREKINHGNGLRRFNHGDFEFTTVVSARKDTTQNKIPDASLNTNQANNISSVNPVSTYCIPADEIHIF